MNHIFFAYIDPGTGSVVLQAVIGFLLGAIFIFRNFFFRLTSVFKKKPVKDQEETTIESE